MEQSFTALAEHPRDHNLDNTDWIVNSVIPHIRHNLAKEFLDARQSKKDLSLKDATETVESNLRDRFNAGVVHDVMGKNYLALMSLAHKTREELVDIVIESGLEAYNDPEIKFSMHDALQSGRCQIAYAQTFEHITVKNMGARETTDPALRYL